MTILAITAAASLLGSAAQTTIGFGAALFLSPVMFLVLGPDDAVLCTLTVVTWLSVIMLAAERHRLQLDRRVSLGLALPALPGVVGGVLVLGLVDEAFLQIAVGLVVLSAVALQLRTFSHEPGRQARPLLFRISAIPYGLTAGALNGAVSTGGPPLAIWLRSAGAGPDQLRHTLAVVFIAINLTTIALVGLIESPQIDERWLRALVGGLIGIPLGYWAGGRILRRIDDRAFGRAVAAALTAVALASLVSGVGGL